MIPAKNEASTCNDVYREQPQIRTAKASRRASKAARRLCAGQVDSERREVVAWDRMSWACDVPSAYGAAANTWLATASWKDLAWSCECVREVRAGRGVACMGMVLSGFGAMNLLCFG